MQNCAIKHGICFCLSVNFSVGLAQLSESLRNYLEAAIMGFSRRIFSLFITACYLSQMESETSEASENIKAGLDAYDYQLWIYLGFPKDIRASLCYWTKI